MSVISQLPRRDNLLASSRFINIKSYKSYFSTKKLIVIALGHLAINLRTIFREALTTANGKFSLRQSMWEFFKTDLHAVCKPWNYPRCGHMNDPINRWEKRNADNFWRIKNFYLKKNFVYLIKKVIQKSFFEGFVSFAFGIL